MRDRPQEPERNEGHGRAPGGHDRDAGGRDTGTTGAGEGGRGHGPGRPGERLATGRSAVIHVWPAQPDTVVKLFPVGYPADAVAHEEAACHEAHHLGLTPVACHGRVRVGEQDGLVLDRVHGPSLTARAERNPLLVRAGARTLAGQHARLHAATTDRFTDVREAARAALATPPLAFLDEDRRSAAVRLIDALPAGDRILHMDFHTENVFVHDDGYAVIDWPTVLRGDPAADVAMSELLIRDAELWPGTPLLKRLAVQTVRRLVLATYLAEYRRLTGMTPERIAAWRPVAVILRMSNQDVASERAGFQRELDNTLGATK